MPFSVATWNINSVRLREPIVCDLLKAAKPDVLCLQEIKCRDDQFPLKKFAALGYGHIAIHGQTGYHGVATLSRHPIQEIVRRQFCGKDDARHIAVVVETGAGPLTIDNFYIPAGGDIPDPAENEKFAHKLDFLHEFCAWGVENAKAKNRIAVGDFNIAAQRLYEKAGFARYGTEPNGLIDDGVPVDEHLMVRFLDKVVN